MEQANRTLKARENKKNIVTSFLKNNESVIIVKANVPGPNKNIPYAYLLVSYFSKIVIDKLNKVKILYFDDFDGPFTLIIPGSSFPNLKEQMVNIEESNDIGRLIDIDVYKDLSSENRNKMRKCFLCDDYAFVCIRRNKHSFEEIANFFNNSIYTYFNNLFITTIANAMLLELNLHPKFGLVTPFSNGSHPDMNYEIMKRAIPVVSEGVTRMFFTGLNGDSLSDVFTEIRQIGIQTEKKMFEINNNINTYKGLIFDLGLMTCSIGYAISHKQCYQDIFNNIKIMTKGLLQELEQGNSLASKFYHEYKIGGARMEACNGFEIVDKIIGYLNYFDDESLTISLIYIIKNIDDTVLLKRAGSISKYRYYKKLIGSIKKYNLNKINKITEICIKGNISCGGAADILIVGIFLKIILKKLYIKMKEDL